MGFINAVINKLFWEYDRKKTKELNEIQDKIDKVEYDLELLGYSNYIQVVPRSYSINPSGRLIRTDKDIVINILSNGLNEYKKELEKKKTEILDRR